MNYVPCFFLFAFLILTCAIAFCMANTWQQFAVKRKAVGIWGCKDCGKVKAGGAYTMKYVMMSGYSVYIESSCVF
jgi:ribosomal protein L37AE/L43A